MSLEQLIPILQTAIGPVILISGVGLLLLSMTNRYARVIDRSRHLADALRTQSPQHHWRLKAQLSVMSRRARLIRLAITLASLSVLLAVLLIILLFLAALLRLQSGLPVALLFIACLLCLIASLVVFLQDLNVSLKALELETGGDGPTT